MLNDCVFDLEHCAWESSEMKKTSGRTCTKCIPGGHNCGIQAEYQMPRKGEKVSVGPVTLTVRPSNKGTHQSLDE
ncbi:hypothetical protein KUCAC02_026617 [Chaenocephalus aceratus]|nr:hypothetical protein KUCAC02_033021 [Chaenocephalus aceratus]KAI4797003.1 hypothetical protein KUCAC02_026617 [Chaenocephalus aceratus]